MRKRHFLKEDAWFCNWISVRGSGASDNEFWFPCYRWVVGNNVLSLPEGTGERWAGSQRSWGAGAACAQRVQGGGGWRVGVVAGVAMALGAPG